MIYTAKHASIIPGNPNIVGLGTLQYIADDEEFQNVRDILAYCVQGRSRRELHTFQKMSGIPSSLGDTLLEQGLLIETEDILNQVSSLSYKNQLYFDAILRKRIDLSNVLSKYTFILVGCGGIGNFLSYAFASLPIKELILIDGDDVELTNLNRQFLFSMNDIGSKKTLALSRELRSRGFTGKLLATLHIMMSLMYVKLFLR